VKYIYETVTVFQATITLCNSCRATHYVGVQYGILKLTPSTCSNRSRVPDKRLVPDTGRGSKQIVLIEAGGFYSGIYGSCLTVCLFLIKAQLHRSDFGQLRGCRSFALKQVM